MTNEISTPIEVRPKEEITLPPNCSEVQTTSTIPAQAQTEFVEKGIQLVMHLN